MGIAIGELKDERLAGTTQAVCQRQLTACLAKIQKDDWPKVSIAYEPVWAIGTGLVATPLQAQETQYQIRQFLADKVGKSIADQVRILYGGSVNPGNCKGLCEL